MNTTIDQAQELLEPTFLDSLDLMEQGHTYQNLDDDTYLYNRSNSS